MKALYTAATGMAAQQRRIENISNNLANVSTVGIQKSRENFEDLLYQSLSTSSAGLGQRVQVTSRLVQGLDLRVCHVTFRMVICSNLEIS